MPIVRSNGIQLAYETLGNPRHEPIILIAGLGLQLISWPDAFCRELVDQGFYVVRFDNRDSGLSTKMTDHGKPNLGLAFMQSMFYMPVRAGYTLDDMAKDTLGLMDALDIESAHIVGASMGGMIAQIIAATAPERTRSLTSIMSTSGRAGLPGPTFAANHALMSRPAQPKNFDSVLDHFVKLFRVLGSPAYPTPEPVLRNQLKASIRRNLSPAGTSRQLLAVTASGDRVSLLRKIRVPTLVIHGSDDPLVPIAGGRDTALLVSGAVFHEIKGMGHDIPAQLELPLAQLIAEHCKKAPPASADSA